MHFVGEAKRMNQIHEVIDLKLQALPQRSNDRETASNQQNTGEPVKLIVIDQSKSLGEDVTYASPSRPKTVAGSRPSGAAPNRQTAIILATATKQSSLMKNVKPIGRSDAKTNNPRAVPSSAKRTKEPQPLLKGFELSRSQHILPTKLANAGSPATSKTSNTTKFTTSVLDKPGTGKKETRKPSRTGSSKL